MNLVIKLFIVSGMVTLANCKDVSFSYDKGTADWQTDYSTCKGKHQSPIDIDILSVKNVQLEPLKFINFHQKPRATHITNNGHTVLFTIEPKKGQVKPTIKGGPIPPGIDYTFAQLHFHWSNNDSYGSEDSFNGKHYAMELHVVFYKTEYKSMAGASNHSDGLVVMAFFFDISNKKNEAYEEFTELLDEIRKPNSRATFEHPITLIDFMQTNFDEYYVYNGSLTTPPCLEIVLWMDFAHHPIPISHDQLEHFRMLEDEEGNSLTHNYRPTQELGDREIWFTSQSFSPDDDNSIDENDNEKPKPRKNFAAEKNFSSVFVFINSIILIIISLHKL